VAETARALATDKKEVVLGVWRGFAQPVNQWMPPGTPWFFNVPDRKVDVEQAKKLLAEAGIAKGTKLTHTVGSVANLVPAAQVFQAQLTRIGIDLQLEVLDWPAYIKRQRAMDFTSTNTNFFPRVDPDDAYYRYFHSKGGANELSGGYANAAADKLLEDGEATVDPAKRAEAYRRLVELIQDEVPVVTTGLGDAARLVGAKQRNNLLDRRQQLSQSQYSRTGDFQHHKECQRCCSCAKHHQLRPERLSAPHVWLHDRLDGSANKLSRQSDHCEPLA